MTTTLYRGGVVRSPDSTGATALLVEGDTVLWVGPDGLAPDGAGVVVDLAGHLVTPAFVDAHVHATATGLALNGLDLSLTVTLPEALDLLAAHARRHRGAPILGHGWDDTRWPEQRPPTRQELDRASYGGVVFLSRIDSHSAVVSSALIAAVPGVEAMAGFSDSGWLGQDAHHAVRRAARDTLSSGQRRDAQRATRQRAAALGIGCFHEMGGPEIAGADDLRDLIALARDEVGPEVIAYWGEISGVTAAQELGAVGAAGDLFVDGSIGSYTAELRHPYVDKPTCGHRYLGTQQLSDHIAACVRAGLQAGFHAIGDGALHALLTDGYDGARRALGGSWPQTRHRIEHAEMVDDALISRIAELGIVASVQPAFDAAWGGADGMYAQRLGRDRALAMNPLAGFAAAGVALAFGSDSPVTPLDPWGTVRAAVRHRSPGSAISAEQAFAAHTTGGWYAAGVDGEGVLAAGAPATFAIWQVDDLAPGATLPDIASGAANPTCLRTVVRGVTIHEQEGALR
ncbi:MAG: amidohydrolase [Mycobacteriales bacterium]